MRPPDVAPHASPSDTVEEDQHAGRVVAHFRVDASARLRRALALGAVIVTVGALVMASAMVVARVHGRSTSLLARRASDGLFAAEVDAQGVPVAHPSAPLEAALGLLGLACVVLGGATTIVGLKRVLAEEAYLALRTDGAYFRRGKERSLVRWDEVEQVRWDTTLGVLRFERHDGSAWTRAERFADVDGHALARRAAEVRRKALFGLLG